MKAFSKIRQPEEPSSRSVRPRLGEFDPPDASLGRPELALLATLTQSQPVLRALGIEMRESLAFQEFDVVAEVRMDRVKVHVVGPGQAVKTGGVATCHALGARTQLADGSTLVGLAHASMARPGKSTREVARFEVERLMSAMQLEMAKTNSTGRVEMFIAGGAVSRVLVGEERRPYGGSIPHGLLLMEAASEWLVSARIGLCEVDYSKTEITDFQARGFIVTPPTTDRFASVSVLITYDKFIVVDCEHDHSPCDLSDDDEGDEGDLSDIGDPVDFGEEQAQLAPDDARAADGQ